LATDPNKSPKPPADVRRLFDELAGRYEFVNRLFALGIDAWWRWQTARRLAPREPGPLFDGATGSAQLAIALARRHPQREVVGLDFSPGMLAIGRTQVARAGLASRIRLVEGDLTRLPLADGAFAGATAAFGVRNVADRRQCLRELRRILHPGGRLALLEFALPTLPLIAPLYRWYFSTVMPFVARRFRVADTYRYLFESVEAFPPPNDFLQMLREAGFANCSATPMTLGTVVLYVAE
jgi:demethylmenaquinone methyltransferase/2-methoxy-6-polyprenyl-1,4-benzoquinol methylase